MSKKINSLFSPLFCIILGCAILAFILCRKEVDHNANNTDKTTEQTTSTGNGAASLDDGQLEIPKFITPRKEQVIVHAGYTVSYNPDWHIPNWVAYELTKSETYGNIDRADHFDPDPDVNGVCPNFRDYSRSGYDRGHMAPAGDMKWDETAMKESFYLSNICPQDHNLNKGDWNTLEENARHWARKYGNIYIVCGPIVSQQPKTIGYNHVAVPDGFYKVFLCKINGKWESIGFYFDNKPGSGNLRDYCKSVDEIERMTGIDFFSTLDDSIENKVEATYHAQAWKL